MGGGRKSTSSFSSFADDLSSIDGDKKHCNSVDLGFEFEEQAEIPTGINAGECDLMSYQGNLRRLAQKANIIKSYINSNRDSMDRIESLNEAILSYTPGSLIDKDKGESLSDFDVPKATTLLVVGFKGSGKSSLVNRISRVFEDEKLASDRAQVSYCSSLGDGTRFLHGYMVPRRSSSCCLFDTPGFSDETLDNDDLIKSWMTNGVRNGELALRESDKPSLKDMLKRKIKDEPIRKVNFVIFAIDGLSVLGFMNSNKEEDTRRAELLAKTYNTPHLSYGDDKPVIVVTRGDLLSHEERARVRIYLGELLGVPPTTQIFDIPESRDPGTELATLEMLKYALEHADKNLPRKSWTSRAFSTETWPSAQVLTGYIILLIILGLSLGFGITTAIIRGPQHLCHCAPLSNTPLGRVHDQAMINRLPIAHPGSFYSHHQAPETRETDGILNFDLSSPTTLSDSETTGEIDQTADSPILNRLVKLLPTELNLGSVFNYTKYKNKASLLFDFKKNKD